MRKQDQHRTPHLECHGLTVPWVPNAKCAFVCMLAYEIESGVKPPHSKNPCEFAKRFGVRQSSAAFVHPSISVQRSGVDVLDVERNSELGFPLDVGRAMFDPGPRTLDLGASMVLGDWNLEL